ncbi:MAG: molybdopterin-dependent oxidoreductase, partial [Pseudomonadales bacterium]|nr:molybdopterin-dependent oxidoreductase [Pseudomonadales bacterium]
VMNEGLPFAAVDNSKLASTARDMGGAISKIMGMQMTGGSSTVPDSYEKLRQAGAVARETLKEAAAQRSGTPRVKLKTKNGRVLFPDGSSVAYTELAADAAQLKPVSDVALRDERQWRLLGKKMLRSDIVAKSTGTEIYGIDLVMDNMLYASVRSNPGMGGMRLNYDAGRAKAMRGVKKIVETRDGVGVIADNTWRAFRAVNSIDIEWGQPDYPASSKEIWDVLANSFIAEHKNSRLKNLGDVETAQQNSSVIEAEYRVPYLAHAPLEPMNAVVLVGDDRLDIWTGTQIPGFIQDHAAKLSGIDKQNVFVHVQPMGGSFGHRLEFSYAMQAR